MKTCYFDRNVFDQIDKNRDVTDDDIKFLRSEIANNHIQILVSFETVQETTYANKETALRGLRLIRDYCRRELPIKPHTELVRDDIRSFAKRRVPTAHFLFGSFSVEKIITDVNDDGPEFLALVEDDKLNKEVLNAELDELVDQERDFIEINRPRTFDVYWTQRSIHLAEVFADRAGCFPECQQHGLDELLKIRSVRITIGALLSLCYAVVKENRRIRSGTSRDLQHAGPMAATDLIVTDDGELRRMLARIPDLNLKLMDLRDLLAKLRSWNLIRQ